MSCKIKDTSAGKALDRVGLNVPEGFFESDSFLSSFGDWTKGKVKYSRTKDTRVNPDGSPKLVFNRDKTQAYYYNKKGYKIPIMNIDFPSIPEEDRDEIAYAVNDAVLYKLYNSIGFSASSYEEIHAEKTLEESYDDIISDIIAKGVEPLIEKTLINDREGHLKMIRQRLLALGIKYSLKEEKVVIEPTDDTEVIENDEKEKSNFSVVQKPSYERSASGSASAEIKFMLEFTPETNSIGEHIMSPYVPSVPLLMDTSTVFATLLENIANIPAVLEDNNFYTDVKKGKAKGKNVIDVYVNKLEGLTSKYPWMESIVTTLGFAPKEFQMQFVQAFSLSKNSISTTEISPSGVYKLMDTTNTGKDSAFIRSDWAETIADRLFSGSKENKSTRADLNSILLNAASVLGVHKQDHKGKKKNAEYHIQETFKIVEPIFQLLDLGIDISVFNNYVNTILSNKKNLKDKDIATTIHAAVGSLIGKFDNISNAKTSDETVKFASKRANLGKLSDAFSEINSSVSEYMATVGAKRIYLYSAPTVLQRQIEELKADPTLIDKILEEVPSLKNSVWLKEWSRNQGALAGLKVSLRGQLQQEGKSVQGKDGKAIGKADYIKNEVYNAIRYSNNRRTPVVATQVPADKTREYLLNPGIFKETENATVAFRTVFKGYIKDEFMKMKEAHDQIQEAISNANGDLELASNALVMGYHLDKKGDIMSEEGIYVGPAFEFKLFEGMNDQAFVEKQLAKIRVGELGTNFEQNINALFDDPRFSTPLENYVVKELSRVFKEQKLYLDSYNIRYTEDQNDPAFNSIDSATKNMYKNNYDPTNWEAITDAIVRDYSVNTIIAKIEYAKLFTGNLQYYTVFGKEGKTDSVRTNATYIKRVPGTYIDGRPIITGITEGDLHFNLLSFGTETILDSELLESSALSDHVKAYYERVDRTDAQGWITPERWEFLMRRTGKLNKDNIVILDKMKRQWKAVEAGRGISQEDELTYKEIKLMSAQPLKGVYFKNDLLNGPVYVKYSQAVLIPAMVANQPKMKSLLKYMRDNNIDEAVADSGVKVGTLKPVTLKFDKKGKLDITGNHIQKLDNRYWRLQQDLPTKSIKDNKIGTQIQKIIISGLRTMGDIEVSPGYTGRQLADAIDSSLGVLSDIGVERFKKEYGIRADNVIEISKFYEPLLEDMKKEGVPLLNVKKGLETGLPLPTFPHIKDKVVNVFLARMKKAATDLLSSGGGFIQVSDHLIGTTEIKQTAGIKLLVDSLDKLKPPRVVGTADNRVMMPGQVFIPHKLIAELVPNYMELSIEELNAIIPDDVRRIIGYRIPTQARASTDILEIVGILPPEMGDSIIAYGEITAKTGSDFDIDKMYLMIPELVRPNIRTEPEATFSTVTETIEVPVKGIKGVAKPEFSLILDYFSDTELLDLDDSTGAHIKQKELKQKEKELKELIDCLWA